MHIWGKGRAAGRVGSDFLSSIASRVGSGQRFAGSGPRKVTGAIRGIHIVTRALLWMAVRCRRPGEARPGLHRTWVCLGWLRHSSSYDFNDPRSSAAIG